MKRKTLILGAFTVLFLVGGGCQSEGRYLGKRVELELPALLLDRPDPWKAIKDRSRYLEISIFCENGTTWTQRFEPLVWDQVTVPSSWCPPESKDIKVEARIWIKSLEEESDARLLFFGKRHLGPEAEDPSETLLIKLQLVESLED